MFLAFACQDHEIECILVRQYSSEADGEYTKMVDIDTSTTMYEATGLTSDENQRYSQSICLVNGHSYNISYSDSRRRGWQFGSYFFITFEDRRLYMSDFAVDNGYFNHTGGYDIFNFSLNFNSDESTQWYYTDVPQDHNYWARDTYTLTDDWKLASPGEFPPYTAVTRYYRLTGTFHDRDHIPFLTTTLRCASGFIYYAQGKEIYRHHMPEGLVTGTTPALEVHEPIFVTASSNKFVHPENGTYVLAFEIHMPLGSIGVADPFLCYSYFGNPGIEADMGSNMFYHGTPAFTCSGSTFDTIDKVFDENSSTSFTIWGDVDKALTYTFDDSRAECLNYYSISVGPDYTFGGPKEWKVYGSNNNEKWDLLDYQTGITFTTSHERKYFSLRTNTKAYNQYRLEVLDSTPAIFGDYSHDVFLIAEWSGYIGVFELPLAARFLTLPNYHFTLLKGYSSIDTIPYCERNDVDFVVSPSLPEGITFDPFDGRILGVPTVSSPLTTYTLTATNEGGDISINFTLEVLEPLCEPGKVPTLFTKIYPQDQIHQCFSLLPTSGNQIESHGDCPENGIDGVYSDWYNATQGIQAFYRCLSPDVYELHLTSFELDNITQPASSWINYSYLNITTLSYTDLNGITYPERVVGQYAYTRLCSPDSNESEDENIATINIGSVNCNADERVVIFEHFATKSANLEGFELYRVDNGQYTLLYSFYGHPTWPFDVVDPYTKTAVCLSYAGYKVVLRHKSIDENNECSRCSGWSTEESIDSGEYTNLDGEVVNGKHPSYMKITALTSSSYNYESELSIDYIIEGENYAVFSNTDGNGRVHIDVPYHEGSSTSDAYSDTDCHYDVVFSLEEAQSPGSCYYGGSYIEMMQNERSCIRGLVATSGTCFLQDVKLDNSHFTITQGDDDCNGVYLQFDIGSYDPLKCYFSRQEYFLYVKPVYNSDLPLQTTIPLSDPIFEKECQGDNSIETYYAYDPFTMLVEEIKHNTICHKDAFASSNAVPPPPGHSYIKLTFSIEKGDIENEPNIAPSALWFKQELEYAIGEWSQVPIRDVYLYGISYNEDEKVNSFTVIVDTAVEYGQDFMLQFNGESDLISSETLLTTISNHLASAYPTYWEGHSLSCTDIDINSTEDTCPETLPQDVDFQYLDGSGVSQTSTLQDVTFSPTIPWYYSYVSVPGSDSYSFDGAVTRYCRPKHYEAVFDAPTDNSLAQQINVPWYDIHFELTMEQQDPRGANIGFRYAVARALSMGVLNDIPSNEHDIETFDVNIYMIKGYSTNGSDVSEETSSTQTYMNTKFFVEVRVRNEEQQTRLYDHLQNDVLDSNSSDGTLDLDFERSFMKGLGSIVGSSYLSNKSIKILNVQKF